MKKISFITLLIAMILEISSSFANTTFIVEGSLGQNIDKDGNLTTKIFTHKQTFNILADEEIETCLSGKFELVSDYPFFSEQKRPAIGSSYYLVYIIECNTHKPTPLKEKRFRKLNKLRQLDRI